MANVIVKCPECGHSFIKKTPKSGIVGGAVGAAVAGALGLSVSIGTLGIGGPIVGGIVGYALTHRDSTCSCPKCNAECKIPEE